MLSHHLRRNIWMLLVFAVLLGCTDEKQSQEAVSFVENYCSILQDSYARADLNIIGRMSTEKEVKKLFPIIQALTATGNVMKTEILEFKVKKAKVEDDKAQVKTTEKWRFWWIDKASGTITKPKVEETYHLEYNLVKVNGQWMVDSIRNLDD